MIIPHYHQRHRSQFWKIITVPHYNTVTSLVAQTVKASAYNAGDPGWIPGSGRFPGEENGNTLQYSCLGKSHGQRSLVGYSPWSCKESDTTERLQFLSHYNWNMFLQFESGCSQACLNQGPHRPVWIRVLTGLFESGCSQAHLHLVVLTLEHL